MTAGIIMQIERPADTDCCLMTKQNPNKTE